MNKELTVDKNIIVLVVDDQQMVAEAIRRMLIDEDDIEFHYCQNPIKAVDIANEVKPTVILQDLVMPDVDGYTLLRFYRANELTKNVPVIVLSTKEDAKAKSEAFANGASDYLVKLPDQIEMVARIRAYSSSYLAQKQRDEAYIQLQQYKKQLEVSKEKLEESNKILHSLSILDGLTGVANRRHFDDMIDQEWLRAVRDKSELSLIMLDIDYFKKYNDNYGHQMGDDCLKSVANILSSSLKRPSDFLARYGGEEFVIILPETNRAGAEAIAEQLRSAVEELAIIHDHSEIVNYITISVGVTTKMPGKSGRPAELLAKADEALYSAKENGRNCYIFAN
jgi:two-component system chemotaxis family response regulator WspR